MNNPMIIWYVAVGLVLLAFLVHLIAYLRSERPKGEKLLDTLKEKDIFFIPGDRRDDNDDDDDFFDDL